METPIESIIIEADIKNAGYDTGELKPCPFCGNKTIITHGGRNTETNIVVYTVTCTNHWVCGASIVTNDRDTPENVRQKAVNNWNKRI